MRPGEWSYHDMDEPIQEYLREKHVNLGIDVGAGGGKYADLLPYISLDAIEIWQEYVTPKLREKYELIFCADARNMIPIGYDIAIFGDVLEHMTRVEAVTLLKKWSPYFKDFIVVLPYMNVQESCGDNPYEKHLQPDLTPELIRREYPMLKLHTGNEKMGFYVKA